MKSRWLHLTCPRWLFRGELKKRTRCDGCMTWWSVLVARVSYCHRSNYYCHGQQPQRERKKTTQSFLLLKDGMNPSGLITLDLGNGPMNLGGILQDFLPYRYVLVVEPNLLTEFVSQCYVMHPASWSFISLKSREEWSGPWPWCVLAASDKCLERAETGLCFLFQTTLERGQAHGGGIMGVFNPWQHKLFAGCGLRPVCDCLDFGPIHLDASSSEHKIDTSLRSQSGGSH